MPDIIRRPSPPTTAWKEVRIQTGVAGAPVWLELLRAAGSFSACDLWFQGPGAEYRQDQIRIFGLNGPQRVPLVGPRAVEDAKAAFKDQGGGAWSALVASIRSRPCDGFQVEIAASALTHSARSHWRLECWWDPSASYSDDAGWLSVDPWGYGGDLSSYRHAWWASTTPLAASTTYVLRPATAEERWDLQYAQITTGDGTARNFTFQLRPPVGAPVVVFGANVGFLSSPWQYQGPGLPGEIGTLWPTGSQWELVTPAITLPSTAWAIAHFRRHPGYVRVQP